MTTFKKALLIGGFGCFLAGLAVLGFFVYLNWAYPPKGKQTMTHLTAPDELSDCNTCHAKFMPALAQDWEESKHGVLLVKCAVCHGQPDGLGAIPFAAQPSELGICARCHEPAMNRMALKTGEMQSCNTCHPNHQNPRHRRAFESATVSGKTEF